jgi:peptidoglycan/xylan/chitin deacetylase (PgdA/CDA1 family)
MIVRPLPWAGLLAALSLSACQTLAPPEGAARAPLHHPVRFLLTFDDGPSAREDFNPTVAIHEQLASNGVQPGVKAIFFVQTRHPKGGATPLGRHILLDAHAAGHVLGVHSGSARGHIRHTTMSSQELSQSLDDGKADLRTLTGHDAQFVRPTFWGYNERTRRVYHEHGLKMLLTDINGDDGILYVLNIKLNQQSYFRGELERVRGQLERGELSQVGDAVPVVITFHDLNAYTARHLTEYMQMLIDEARALGIPVAARPFYDDATAVIEAAGARAVPTESALDTRLPPPLARPVHAAVEILTVAN